MICHHVGWVCCTWSMKKSTDVLMREIEQAQSILTRYGPNRYWHRKLNQLTAEMQTRNVLNFSENFI